MKEQVFSGPEMIYIVTEAQEINEWNCIKFQYKGIDISAAELKLIVQNDPSQD